MPESENWNAKTRVAYTGRKVLRYSVVFFRKHDDGWYDEIRYDSHDRTRGGFREAPHFHMKLRSAFKSDTDRAEAEIRTIIVTELLRIETITLGQAGA